MRLLLRSVLLLMGAAALALPATALAAGNGPGHQHTNTVSSGVVTHGAGDRDVPGTANDPSAPRHDHDNGIGNDCDPGLGGSPNDTGNDARFGEGDTTCRQQSGQVKGTHETKPPTSTATPAGGSVEAASATARSAHAGSGSVSSAGAVSGAVGAAAANGVGLAQTGLGLPLYAVLGGLLIGCGVLLMRRRRRLAGQKA